MHDPQTLAFEVKRPWPKKAGTWRYFPPIVTVWHVDPEADGTDDSCGWFAKMQAGDHEWCRDTAETSWASTFDELGLGDASVTEVLWYAWCLVRSGLVKERRGYILAPLPYREFQEVLGLACNPSDNLASAARQAKLGAHDYGVLLTLVARCQRRFFRPWWRHPRWHIHHWKLQIHPLQEFKRWAFSRCDGCGERFSWGYSPVTGQWHSTGPLWFRSEKGVYHDGCMQPIRRPEQGLRHG